MMANQEARKLMRLAWDTRRSSFEAEPEQRRVLIMKAKEDLAAAVALCRDDSTPVELAQALHLLANVEHDTHRDERAQSLWEEAVAILRQTDDVLQLAHKVRHLGDLHRHCDRLSEAEKCYDEALALYRAHDRPGSLDLANAVRRVAILKELLGDKDRALTLWNETRELYLAVQKASGVDLTAGVKESEQHIGRRGE
jgi:tetratricopeptide (TPR) repeat protein